MVSYSPLLRQLPTSCLLLENPKAWGYLPLGDQPSFVTDESLPDPPFRLYIVGSGYLDLPVELKNVVSLHVDLEYDDYYTFMNTMDICIPAFANEEYYIMQASSTMAMAVECNVSVIQPQPVAHYANHLDGPKPGTNFNDPTHAFVVWLDR
jgi:hypothetical protein